MAYSRNYSKYSLRMVVNCHDLNGDPIYKDDGITPQTQSATFSYLNSDATDENIMAAYTAIAGLQRHIAQEAKVITEAVITNTEE